MFHVERQPFFILRYFLATLIDGHFPRAFRLPFAVEHIAMNRCCRLLFAGIRIYLHNRV